MSDGILIRNPRREQVGSLDELEALYEGAIVSVENLRDCLTGEALYEGMRPCPYFADSARYVVFTAQSNQRADQILSVYVPSAELRFEGGKIVSNCPYLRTVISPNWEITLPSEIGNEFDDLKLSDLDRNYDLKKARLICARFWEGIPSISLEDWIAGRKAEEERLKAVSR